MNDTGLAIFAVDVRFIVQHATSVFPNMASEASDVFEELSQMVALLQSDELTEFLDPDIRELGFPRVQNQRLQYALVKVSFCHSSVFLNIQVEAYPALIQLTTYYNSVSQNSIDAKRRSDAEKLFKAIA